MTETFTTTRLRDRLRRIPRWIWVLGAIILLTVAGIYWWRGRAPEVTLATAEIGAAVSAVYAPGAVLSGVETVIAATAAARVVQVYVQRGSAVAPGQVVAQLDDQQARLALAEAERRADTARAQLAQVSEPGDPRAVAQAQAQYRQARTAVTAAQAQARAAREQVTQARAAIEGAQARVTTLRRSAEAAAEQADAFSAQIDAAQAQVARARAETLNARDNLRRQRALFEAGAVAERRVVEADTAYRAAEAAQATAEANVRVARQNLAQAREAASAARSQVTEAEHAVDEVRGRLAQAQETVNAAEAQIAQAQASADAARAQLALVQEGQRASAVEVARAQVRAAEAAVAQTRSALAEYTVRSLVAGTVSAVPVSVGDFVVLGAAIARVVSERDLYVEADVDEADIGPVAIGQRAFFTADAIPDRSFEGVVTQIGASADPATNTYPVEIREIVNPDGLRVNMSVDVNIVTQTDRQAVLIPVSALVLGPPAYVWIVDSQRRLQQRFVTVGAREQAGGRVAITSGLQAGEQVVRQPQSDFRAGQRVRVAAPGAQ